MAKIKIPIPLSGGINTQADSSQYANEQLHNARNAFYRRDDMTLRRRPDIAAVGAGSISSPTFTIQGCTFFGDTDKTFRKFVYSIDTSGAFAAGTLAATDTESPGVFATIGGVQMGTNGYLGLRKSVQYNNLLYWPSIAGDAGYAGACIAWNGTTSGVREAGIDIQNHGTSSTTFAINVAGAGSLTMATGRKYTFTLYDPVNVVESMPTNASSTLRTVTTGIIAAKGPVVTVTWSGIITPNVNNTANNHTAVRFYATTDGGVTYYFHSQVAITPDANTLGAVATFTDAIPDTTLITGDILVYNSPPPPAKFMAKFENKLVAGGAKSVNASVGATTGAGEGVVSNVLYYTLTDEPEHWPRNLVFNTTTNAIPFRDQDGDELVGGIQVNRVLLVGLNNSVWSINHLPIASVDPLFDFSTLKDRIADTHGFISSYCYCNLALTDDEDAVFYVSKRGFHLNNGAIDKLINSSIRWDETIYNSSQSGKIHVTNDTSNYIIVVGFPSVSSSVVDSAYVYHYHPSHIDETGVGKITGPWDYNLATSTFVLRANNTKELWGVSGSVTVDNQIVKLTGNSGIDYTSSAISFEWETGWMRGADDAAIRLREANFTVEEADTATLPLGTSSIAQTLPTVKTIQLNSSSELFKLLWDDDVVTLKQVTGSGDEIGEVMGSVSIITTDRALVSCTVDAEVFGEEKSMDLGVMVVS